MLVTNMAETFTNIHHYRSRRICIVRLWVIQMNRQLNERAAREDTDAAAMREQLNQKAFGGGSVSWAPVYDMVGYMPYTPPAYSRVSWAPVYDI